MGLKIIDKIIDRFEAKQKLKSEIKRAKEFSANKKAEQAEIFQTLVLLYSQSSKIVQEGRYDGWVHGSWVRFYYPSNSQKLCEVLREDCGGYSVDVVTPGKIFNYHYGYSGEEFNQSYAEQLYNMFKNGTIPPKLYLKTLLYDVKHK